MRKLIAVGVFGLSLALAPAAFAHERLKEGVMGAVAGAVAGPVGAVAGGAIGYTQGPHIAHRIFHHRRVVYRRVYRHPRYRRYRRDRR